MKVVARICIVVTLLCALIFLIYVARAHRKEPSAQILTNSSIASETTGKRSASKLEAITSVDASTLSNIVDKYIKSKADSDRYISNEQIFLTKRQYNILFSKLKLTPADEKRLLDLLKEKNMLFFEIPLVASRNEQFEKSISEEAQESLHKHMLNDIDAEIAELLGVENYNVFKKFEIERSYYNFIKNIQERLAYTEEPISVGQMHAAVEIISKLAAENAKPAENYYDILLALPDNLITPGQKASISKLQIENENIQRLKDAAK